MGIKWIGSPNFTQGRGGHTPSRIVIHISQGTLAGADSWFNNLSSQVSSHYFIAKTGEIHQYVKEEDTAWHCASYPIMYPNPASPEKLFLDLNPNLYTIGVEHEGFTGEEWTLAMFNASLDLVAEICSRWNLPTDRVHIIGHYEINSKNRAQCPGRDLDDYVTRLKYRISLKQKTMEETNNLRANVASLENSIAGLNSEIEKLRKENSDLKTSLDLARDDLSHVSKELGELRLNKEIDAAPYNPNEKQFNLLVFIYEQVRRILGR